MRASCEIDAVYVLKTAMRYLNGRKFSLISQAILLCFTELSVHHIFVLQSGTISVLKIVHFLLSFSWFEGNHNHNHALSISSEVRESMKNVFQQYDEREPSSS